LHSFPTRRSSDLSVVVEAAGFACRVLHHVLAHGHLAIGNQHDFVVLAHAQNRSAVQRRTSLIIAHRKIIAPETVVSQKPRDVARQEETGRHYEAGPRRPIKSRSARSPFAMPGSVLVPG